MDDILHMTNRQARQFMLLKQGLLGNTDLLENRARLIMCDRQDASNLTRLMPAERMRSLHCSPG